VRSFPTELSLVDSNICPTFKELPNAKDDRDCRPFSQSGKRTNDLHAVIVDTWQNS
jgi:hypothetical protein